MLNRISLEDVNKTVPPKISRAKEFFTITETLLTAQQQQNRLSVKSLNKKIKKNKFNNREVMENVGLTEKDIIQCILNDPRLQIFEFSPEQISKGIDADNSYATPYNDNRTDWLLQIIIESGNGILPNNKKMGGVELSINHYKNGALKIGYMKAHIKPLESFISHTYWFKIIQQLKEKTFLRDFSVKDIYNFLQNAKAEIPIKPDDIQLSIWLYFDSFPKIEIEIPIDSEMNIRI